MLKCGVSAKFGPMSANQYATAVNCIDGRVQMPVFEYIKTMYGVDFVDMITEPGPIRTLSENGEKIIIESIRRRVEISVLKHNSELIALVGHHDNQFSLEVNG